MKAVLIIVQLTYVHDYFLSMTNQELTSILRVSYVNFDFIKYSVVTFPRRIQHDVMYDWYRSHYVHYIQ